MRITRRQLRRLITESAGGLTPAQKLAQGFKSAGEDVAFIKQNFELAVTLGHAQDGTLDTIAQYGGGRIVDFVASPDLAVELHKIMGRIKIGQDRRYPGMYYVAYAVN